MTSGCCPVAPSPELRKRFLDELAKAEGEGRRGKTSERDALRRELGLKRPKTLGLDDGLILPASEFPPGVSDAELRGAASRRPPLRGEVRVIVSLVDFDDRDITATRSEIDALFF